MTDLEKALENTEGIRAAVGLGYVYRDELANFETILDAARRFANLTSPETIEKGALGLLRYRYPEAVWNKIPSMMRTAYLNEAQAVLRAVEEGET